MSSEGAVGLYKADDVVDVTLKRRALDTVRSKQGLRLARVVKLFDEEIRHRGVW